MIISHKWRFIFIKTQKCAGSSVERALAPVCGPDDVLTRASSPEMDGASVKPHEAQNTAQFHEHMQARAVRDAVSPEIWDSYYKFAIVRNPWERMVSVVWFRLALRKGLTTRAARLTMTHLGMPATRILFHEMVRRRAAKTACHDYVSMITDTDGVPLVDDVLRYEDLNNEIDRVRKKLGMPEVELPRLKGQYRKDRRPYPDYYDRITRERVARCDHAIIENFGYSFD